MDAQSRSPTVDDYAKAIYALESRRTEPVSTTALAERLDLTPASVSGMLKRLDEQGVITYTPYHGVRLTGEGRRIALSVVRRHRLLELFLAETLGLPWDRVHDEAEVLEHALSDELADLIADKLGQPTVDPHGDPIPSAAFELQEPATRSLQELEVGARGVFVRVSDSNPQMLRYLSEQGIAPGHRVEVVERQPFGGPLFIRIGAHVHPVGGELARAMRVDTTPASRDAPSA